MSGTASPAIEAVELAKSYGDHLAVDGVSFRVARGEIYAYLGRNGSGKTTTVRMLTTLTPPVSGAAHVAGFSVTDDPAEVRSRIGVTMQAAALDPGMSGAEHLEFIAGMLGHDRSAARRRSVGMLELFGLSDAASRPIGTYSGGMQRRLDIATALLGDPEVLFLDEPTTGLDPQSRRALWDEIVRMKERGVTVFLTTQYLEEADQLADHVAIIDRGRIIARGTTTELKAQHGRKQVSFVADPAAGSLVDELAAWPGVDVVSTNGRVRVEADPDVSERELLGVLTTALAAGEGAPSDIEMHTTTLEDVFIRLTGTSINEART